MGSCRMTLTSTTSVPMFQTLLQSLSLRHRKLLKEPRSGSHYFLSHAISADNQRPAANTLLCKTQQTQNQDGVC